jgi:toxin ParE1/3/4
MRGILISPAAELDIESILVWTRQRFGERARLRYGALLTQGIADVAEDPRRMGSSHRPEIADIAQTYHLWHGRNHVPVSVGRVKKPRHLLL